MSIEIVVFGFGGLLLLTGILGGGFEIKELKIPAINRGPRFLASFAGLVMILLGIGLASGSEDQPEPTRVAATQDYRDRIRSICDKDRNQEIQLKQQAEVLRHRIQEGDEQALVEMVPMVDDAVAKYASLLGELEALDPPSGAEITHRNLISLWRRQTASNRAYRDRISNATTQEELLQALESGDPAEEERIDHEGDVLLRRLAGSGCDPAP